MSIIDENKPKTGDNGNSEFDDLVAWANGNQSTESVAEQIETASTVRATSAILADRVNSARLAHLVKALEQVDDHVLERLDSMDDATLLRTRRDLEESIDKTSTRVKSLEPGSLKREASHGGNGVNIQQVFPPSATAPAKHTLDRDSRTKVQQLVAKVAAAAAPAIEVVDADDC